MPVDSVVAVLPDGAALVAVRKMDAYGPMGYSLRLDGRPLVTVDGRNGELREPLLSAFLDRPPTRATPAPFGNAWVRAGDEASEIVWLVQPRLGVVVQWTTVDRDEDGFFDCPGVAPWLPRAFPLGRPPAYVVVQGGPADGYVVPILGRTVVRGDDVPLPEPFELVVEPDADGFFVALSDHRGAFEGHVPHGAALRVGDSILRIAYHLDDRAVWQGAFTPLPPAELFDGRTFPDRIGAHVGGALFVSVDGVSARFTTSRDGYFVEALDDPSAVTLGSQPLVHGAMPTPLRHGDALAFSGRVCRVFRHSPHPFVEMPAPLGTAPAEAPRAPSAFVARPFRPPEPSLAELVANILCPPRPRLREVLRAMRRWRTDVLAENAEQTLWRSLNTRDLRCRFPLFNMDRARPRRFGRRAPVAAGIEPGVGIEEVDVPDLALTLALTSDPSGAETAEALALRAAELASNAPGAAQAIRWSVIPWRVPRGRTFPDVASITDAAQVVAMDAALPPGVRSLAAWQLLQYDAWRGAAPEGPAGPDPGDPHLLLLRILSLGYLVDELRDGVLDLIAPMPDLADADDPLANAAGLYPLDRFTRDLDARMKQPLSLVVISPGKHLGRRYSMPEGSHILGSSAGAGIHLDDRHGSVAAEHARIDVNGLAMHITPLATHETAFVNGYVQPQRRSLVPGDRIRLGAEVELELVE
ncbi:FHA domain-containing protein [Polyangium sp. y55x31]|uniref:FHA domain-containing protein n=1 Tax=Polyangium sp. y55x31 TaxID=3042688 RepID=UPI002482AC06|nr:FHA domain-containing protein [Polyangium sp. y55x31]MDI1475702.1 FHA domain-containing protein [Polyangium sp. y55x31]